MGTGVCEADSRVLVLRTHLISFHGAFGPLAGTPLSALSLLR